MITIKHVCPGYILIKDEKNVTALRRQGGKYVHVCLCGVAAGGTSFGCTTPADVISTLYAMRKQINVWEFEGIKQPRENSEVVKLLEKEPTAEELDSHPRFS